MDSLPIGDSECIEELGLSIAPGAAPHIDVMCAEQGQDLPEFRRPRRAELVWLTACLTALPGLLPHFVERVSKAGEGESEAAVDPEEEEMMRQMGAGTEPLVHYEAIDTVVPFQGQAAPVEASQLRPHCSALLTPTPTPL